MALNKIKAALVQLYDRLTAQKATISIGDIVNQRTDIESNQFLLTTRLLDIEDYCERGIKSFNWQNSISRKAYGEKHREQDGNNAFTRLIESYKEKGYDPNSYFVVDQDIRLLDGNHRMGMNLYMGTDTINVRVLKRKSRNPKAIDWYLTVGLDSKFIRNVVDKFALIQQRMMDSGNVFCAIVSDENLAKDITSLTRDARTDNYNGLPNGTKWGGYELPSEGVLIRFTLHEPNYYISNGFVYSKRAEEIKRVIDARIDTPAVVSRSCLEGKELFSVVEQYLIV